jgi:MFS family permease
MAGAAVAPALGRISQAFPETDPTLIKMVTTLPALVIIAASLLVGQLARAMPKRALMIAGLVIYLVGGLAGGVASSVAMLLAFRAVLGLGVGIISPLLLTLIADFFTGETRSRYMGYQAAVSNLGGVITTVLAGWLAAMSWRYTFAVYALAGGVLILVALGLPEPPRTRAAGGTRARLPLTVYGMALLGLLVMMGFYVVPTSAAMFMQREGIGDASRAGLVFATLTFSSFLVGLVFGRISRVLGAWTAIAGAALVGSGFWLLSVSVGLPAVLGSVVLVGLGLGIALPALITATANLVPSEATSRAMSLFNSCMYLGQFLSPIVFGALGALAGDLSARFSFRLAGLGFALAVVVSTVASVLSKVRSRP